MLVTLYEIGKIYFGLLGTNGFHVKAEKKRFTALGSSCRQNLNVVIWQTRQKIAPKSVPHVQHDHFSSFNQSYRWVVIAVSVVVSKLPIRSSDDDTNLKKKIPDAYFIISCNMCGMINILTNEVFIWQRWKRKETLAVASCILEKSSTNSFLYDG